MICLVDDGWLVSGSLPSDIQRIAVHNLIGCCSHYLAGESVLTVGSSNLQLDQRIVDLYDVIYLIHPTSSTTAMQTMVTTIVLVVLTQLVC